MADRGEAWVTLATNDSYALGALVLAHSLKNVKTTRQLVVMITSDVSESMREQLCRTFDLVETVNVMDSNDQANLELLNRPELGVTFTKLHCWRLTQFSKCVFMDADTLVLQNCDELFEREELSAAPDIGWPDCFNSGVFVFRPSHETYASLLSFALTTGSFDGGDQGLLNMYFSDWATKDISKHLSFVYNTVAATVYSYLPAYRHFGSKVKVVHFFGGSKPWMHHYDGSSGHAHVGKGDEHLSDNLNSWWSLFRENVLPEMESPQSYVRMYHQRPQEAPQQPHYHEPQHHHHDPQHHEPQHHHHEPQHHHHEPQHHHREPQHHKSQHHHHEPQHHHDPQHCHHEPPPPHYEPPHPQQHHEPPPQHHEPPPQHHEPPPQHHMPSQPPTFPIQEQAVYFCQVPEPLLPIATVGSRSESNESPKMPLEDEAKTKEKGEAANVAASMADLKEQDEQRRARWEQGRMDYMGADSFQSIEAKLAEVMLENAPEPKQKKETSKKK